MPGWRQSVLAIPNGSANRMVLPTNHRFQCADEQQKNRNNLDLRRFKIKAILSEIGIITVSAAVVANSRSHLLEHHNLRTHSSLEEIISG